MSISKGYKNNGRKCTKICPTVTRVGRGSSTGAITTIDVLSGHLIKQGKKSQRKMTLEGI